MKTIALLLLMPITLLAQDAFEQPPTLSAAAILKPEFAAGPGFTVRDPVSTYAGRNGYMIDSDAGVFAADGNVMLVQREREIAAILAMRNISRTDTYKNALVAATASPLLLAKGLITNPVNTVTGVPTGIWKFMNRTGQSIKERGQGRERSQYEDSNAAQLIGFSKVKRSMALQLGVDPYSSNEELQRELNGISWAAYAGKMTFTLGTAPIGGAAGLALSSAGVTDALNKALLDQSPADLRLGSLKRLLAMGCDKTTANSFLNNAAYSPSVQTALVLNLDAMTGVANRAAFIQLADSQSQSEGDANFFAQTSSVLADLHNSGRTMSRIVTLGPLPLAIGTDGSLIVALQWDYACWTQNAANFIAQLKSAKVGGKPASSIVVALSGAASPMVQQNLKNAGILLATRIAPGPLQ